MSTTTLSNPSPSESWSPGAFPSINTTAKPSEIATPPLSNDRITTPFPGRANPDSQPGQTPSPSYFNIIGDRTSLHLHFTPQLPTDGGPSPHCSFAKTQRHLPSTPARDISRTSDGPPAVASTPWHNTPTVAQQQDSCLTDKQLGTLTPWAWAPSDASSQTISTMHLSRSSSQSHHTSSSSAPSLSSITGTPGLKRSETSPPSIDSGGIKIISGDCCKDLITSHSDTTLFLDIRPYPQYCRGWIKGALNLCIPTTLLKRPSFNLQKLQDTLAGDAERTRFSNWRNSTRIVAYDASTSLLKDATSLINILKKFTNEGWMGEPLILRGGFSQFSEQNPTLVDRKQDTPTIVTRQPLSISLSLPGISGGCLLPQPNPSINPMYNSIRLCTDLNDGVGQIPLKLPKHLSEHVRQSFPSWLVQASETRDSGKLVSSRFLQIERSEKARMEEALSDSGTYSRPSMKTPRSSYRIAGIEMGSKNRYSNIYPYEHSRVKLGNAVQCNCDYVNASNVKASRSNKLYIATQAPLPSTFKDFWHVVWEQDARVIVMLTAESEGPQLKCDPYWRSSNYGPLRVELINESKVPLNIGRSPGSPNKRTHSRRESTAPAGAEEPYMTVRHITLIHSSLPFEPMREITQLQYSNWPDFGAPAQPSHLLRVIEETNRLSHINSGRPAVSVLNDPEPPSPRKIIVHCSAGCGRTGTFCTVDSVMDMLRRQKRQGENEDEWVYGNDTDLVASTVEDFRRQRPSMVQSLRQFVLCYETILEWLASQPEYKNK
ncbi:phosphotyrosine-specific ptp2-like protein [Ophidiomyces ophidiicola]|nr:phosphotyrosine-specific ptp2-like protein [Ophidiomyces ophidiicola]KAI1918398.1 phosphotyrosine-specific ptp2-like protein [Ophidiomyces ophidiicola]KAI1925854.1 phosphotyrosine-specific ptp2-like protein [Ophidiomyces ophidiicola]KAI1964272.1 phosphotyrosine-specific ptp2-like protein [Ophidiomyces ophidiicola]KAI2009230.1 phosphotyrosine-specific ptp2-like protein [Ophidiomyces ophidiicola]